MKKWLFFLLLSVPASSFSAGPILTSVILSTGATQRGGFHTSTGTVDRLEASTLTVTTSVVLTTATISRLSVSTLTVGNMTATTGTITNLTVSSETVSNISISTLTLTSSLQTGPGLTSGTSGYSLISRGDGVPPFWSAMRIYQSSQCVVVTSSITSNSSAFILTNLSCTITPLISGNQIWVEAEGAFRVDVASSVAYATIFRGSTNLGNVSFGMSEIGSNGQVANFSTLLTTLHLHYLDSPATTSPTTYSIRIKQNTGGGNTCAFGDGLNQVMTLFEIGPQP